MKNIIENIKKISILPSDTIRTALKKITETSNKCLIVTNINSKFLGKNVKFSTKLSMMNENENNNILKKFLPFLTTTITSFPVLSKAIDIDVDSSNKNDAITTITTTGTAILEEIEKDSLNIGNTISQLSNQVINQEISLSNSLIVTIFLVLVISYAVDSVQSIALLRTEVQKSKDKYKLCLTKSGKGKEGLTKIKLKNSNESCNEKSDTNPNNWKEAMNTDTLIGCFGHNEFFNIGEEYKEKNFTGKGYCKTKGIEIYYNSRDHRFSSSGLRKQVKSAEDK